MRFTFEPKTDMGYIYIVEDPSKGIVTSFILPDDNAPKIVVDVYPDGTIHGIEVFGATHQLGKKFIESEAH